MTRKQLILFYNYFNKWVDHPLIRYEARRLFKNIDLKMRNYIDVVIENAPEPDLEPEAYFFTILKNCEVRNKIFHLIAEDYSDIEMFEEREKELVDYTNSLLNSLALPTL